MIAPDMDPNKSDFRGISFNGVFDGNGHLISHLTIAGKSYLGLFGRLDSWAVISNLGLEAVDVNRPGDYYDGGYDYVGGFVGDNGGSITKSFWDTETSGQAMSAGGIGKTTDEMQTGRTFLDAGWDFVDETANGTEDIWWIDEGKD